MTASLHRSSGKALTEDRHVADARRLRLKGDRARGQRVKPQKAARDKVSIHPDPKWSTIHAALVYLAAAGVAGRICFCANYALVAGVSLATASTSTERLRVSIAYDFLRQMVYIGVY